jgi:hypothetical protein
MTQESTWNLSMHPLFICPRTNYLHPVTGEMLFDALVSPTIMTYDFNVVHHGRGSLASSPRMPIILYILMVDGSLPS